MEHSVRKNNVVLIGIGGAGVNTVKRLSVCTRMLIDAENTISSIPDIEKAFWLDSKSINDGFELSDIEKAKINDAINRYSAVLICAGLGGITGSNIAPIIAELAKKQGKLVVAVVFKPFGFEGRRRLEKAEQAIWEIQKSADCTILVSNDELKKSASSRITMAEVFAIPDSMITEVIDIISMNRSGIIKMPQTSDINMRNTTVKCPVCASIVDSNDLICPICGFEQLGFIAINKDEAEIWFKSTVIPARQKWETQNNINSKTIDSIKSELISRMSVYKIVRVLS